jgi:hypothetical protein
MLLGLQRLWLLRTHQQREQVRWDRQLLALGLAEHRWKQ